MLFELVHAFGLGEARRILRHLCPITAFLRTVNVDGHQHLRLARNRGSGIQAGSSVTSGFQFGHPPSSVTNPSSV